MVKTKDKSEESEEKKVVKSEKANIKEGDTSSFGSIDKEDKKAKLAKLLEKAKELEKGVKEVKEISKEEVKTKAKTEKEVGEKKEMLMPIEDFLKSSIYLGTRVITPDMKKYVYRRRADGLAVFNTSLLDEEIRKSADYLAKFEPKDIIVICKREAGWKAVSKFAEMLGIRAFTKKYPAGILTNTNLVTFQEANLILICDPWLDKNALADAKRIKIPVMSVCDTNNYASGITQILPGNNKSAKALGFIFYLLTKLYIEKKNLKIKAPAIQEFVEDWDNLQPPQ
ncbi:MAG TPA: 30S ribosomal protein S2 [Candidatus Nanoarchaeia archaeon]|nr:30S ribosomal protein S2 [Candidatus Nanoarchaeia archaeon]